MQARLALLILAAAALTAAPRSARASEPAITTRDALVLFIPSNGVDTSTAALFEQARAPLEGRARLTLRAPADPTALAKCADPGVLACWVRNVSARYLLVLSVKRADDKEKILSAMLIDLERAAEETSASLTEDPGSIDNRENRIFERAAHAIARERLKLDDPKAVTGYFDRLFGTELAPMFQQSGHWFPNGRLELTSEQPDLSIMIDGQLTRQMNSGKLTFDGLAAGRRMLEISDPHGELVDEKRELVIRAGATTTVSIALARAPNAWRAPVMYGGAALLAGSVVAGVLAVTRDNMIVELCPSGDCPDSSTSRFASSASRGSADGGVRLAPLAFALGSAGAAWLGGTLLFTRDNEPPWLPVIAGVVLGAAAYAVSAAIDQR